jgi:LmbE family N-acetylglucosaminyl deacetylase
LPMAALMDEPRIRSVGTPEAQWQAWAALHRIPSARYGHWLDPGSRLTVIAPHPDDEILACGALLAEHARAGGSTKIVAVTDGEASHSHNELSDRQTLGETRRAEQVAGLSILGVEDEAVQRLRLPDGQVALHANQLERQLSGILLDTDLVISTWRSDGHPDHEACGLTAAKVCAARKIKFLEAPVWMWHWASPGDQRVPWPRLCAFEMSAEANRRRRSAIVAHASQLSRRGQRVGPVLATSMLARLDRDREYFFFPY